MKHFMTKHHARQGIHQWSWPLWEHLLHDTDAWTPPYDLQRLDRTSVCSIGSTLLHSASSCAKVSCAFRKAANFTAHTFDDAEQMPPLLPHAQFYCLATNEPNTSFALNYIRLVVEYCKKQTVKPWQPLKGPALLRVIDVLNIGTFRLSCQRRSKFKYRSNPQTSPHSQMHIL